MKIAGDDDAKGHRTVLQIGFLVLLLRDDDTKSGDGRGANKKGFACGACDGVARCESGNIQKQLANFLCCLQGEASQLFLLRIAPSLISAKSRS